jgi:hypothetical protein
MRNWPTAVKLALILALALVLLPLVVVSFVLSATTFFSENGRKEIRYYWRKSRQWVIERDDTGTDTSRP